MVPNSILWDVKKLSNGGAASTEVFTQVNIKYAKIT